MADSAARQRELMFMFERVGESLCLPRNNNRVSYNLPKDFLNDTYSSQSSFIADRFSVPEDAISVRVQPLKQVPNLTTVMTVERGQNFSIFSPNHKKAVQELNNLFMGAPDYETFKSLAIYTHERVNTELWTYCLAVAITNRQDLRGIQVPSLAEVLPNKCIPASTLQAARERAKMLGQNNEDILEIPLTFTADNKNPEQRVAYFREDIGINLHHWHWHLVYPTAGDRALVDKNRRGELFYYAHQQIIGRYNTERLCNDLNYVIPLDSFREPIPEGYFSKLDNINSGRAWQGRPDNMPLRPINRPDYGLLFNAEILETWSSRIQEAITRGQVETPDGQRMPLSEQQGIDMLGNMVEASILSPNFNLYGDLHSYMHMMVGLCHDPDRSHMEDVSVVGDLATTMRDPAFFRIHSRVNNIFKSHKDSLPIYGPDQLSFNGIRVVSSKLVTEGSSENGVLETHWETSDIQLNRGLDFSDRGSTFARIQYLQHVPFTYHIMVENTTGSTVDGTIRIFIGIKRGENKQEIRFEEQRGLMLEMDKFVQQLQPGVNEFRRRSDESSVTIPYEQTFRRLMDNIAQNTLEENYCGCGWPQHMLVPKGREQGMEFDLFVMVSNWQNDQVPRQSANQGPLCKNAFTMCGSRGQDYPDLRSMGYPFDRQVRDAPLLIDFVRPYANMNVSQITIRHTDRVIHKGEKAN